jgi:hypothetical protein
VPRLLVPRTNTEPHFGMRHVVHTAPSLPAAHFAIFFYFDRRIDYRSTGSMNNGYLYNKKRLTLTAKVASHWPGFDV